MKFSKRIVAGGMGLIMMLGLNVSANAAARSSADTYWSVDYIYGAPSSVSSQICDITVGPFPKGMVVECDTLYGDNPTVTVTSEAFGCPLIINSIGSYIFDRIPGTTPSAFSMRFVASAPRCKADGYVYANE